MRRFFSFRNLWRVNAVIIFLAGLAALVAIALTFWQINRQYEYLEKEISAEYASDGQKLKIVGAQIGTITAYSFGETEGLFPDSGTENATFINMENGLTMDIIEDNDARHIISWTLLQTTQDNQQQAIGYVAMVSAEPDFKNKNGDIVVGVFSEMRRFAIASKIEAMDSPQLIGDDKLSVILWSSDDTANFVTVDLNGGNVLERWPIKLPEAEKK